MEVGTFFAVVSNIFSVLASLLTSSIFSEGSVAFSDIPLVITSSTKSELGFISDWFIFICHDDFGPSSLVSFIDTSVVTSAGFIVVVAIVEVEMGRILSSGEDLHEITSFEINKVMKTYVRKN